MSERNSGRGARDFARSDDLRDHLIELGVIVEDHADGTSIVALGDAHAPNVATEHDGIAVAGSADGGDLRQVAGSMFWLRWNRLSGS